MKVGLSISGGFIQSASLFGDFFGQLELSDLESALVGVEHRQEAIEKALSDINIDRYISGCSSEELCKVLA